MYEIGKRAGVGQATLYRHFPDRAALAITLAGEMLDALEAELDQHPEDALEATLRALVAGMVRSHGLIAVIREGEDVNAEHELKTRLMSMLNAPLCEAKRAGRVREAIAVDDLFLIMQMVEGVLTELPESGDRCARADRALDLVLAGLLA
jgi:AcrR family transcriptional regulator